MLREVTVTYLEMASREELQPAAPPPQPVALERLGPDSAQVIRSIYLAIGAPHGWTSRPSWSTPEWEQRLRHPGVQVWLARVDERPAGLVELEAEPGGDTEIVVFGLLPELVGRGLGGHLLEQGIRLAWDVDRPDGDKTARVWLHTSSHDHPHAMRNYERRGFTAYREEHRRHEVPDHLEPAS